MKKIQGPAQKSLGENTDVCTPSFSTPTGHLSEPFGSLVLGSLLGCLTPFQFLKNLDAQWLTLSTMAKRLLNFMKVFLVIRMTSWLYWPPGSHINGWDTSSQCWMDLLGSHSYTEKPNCRDSWHLESRACS